MSNKKSQVSVAQTHCYIQCVTIISGFLFFYASFYFYGYQSRSWFPNLLPKGKRKDILIHKKNYRIEYHFLPVQEYNNNKYYFDEQLRYFVWGNQGHTSIRTSSQSHWKFFQQNRQLEFSPTFLVMKLKAKHLHLLTIEFEIIWERKPIFRNVHRSIHYWVVINFKCFETEYG